MTRTSSSFKHIDNIRILHFNFTRDYKSIFTEPKVHNYENSLQMYYCIKKDKKQKAIVTDQ